MPESDTTHLGHHDRGYLPHIDLPDRHHAITYRLADSLPESVLRQVSMTRNDHGDHVRRRIDAWLDAGWGSSLLRQPDNARIVIDAWRHFADVRYRLDAWVVMPNHVHLVIRVASGWPLDGIIKSWKAYTARAINRRMNRQGQVWHHDYWDRLIRDEDHWFAAVRYVHENPVRAGLVRSKEEWGWSSAWISGSTSRPPTGSW